jgi:cell division protein FtsX
VDPPVYLPFTLHCAVLGILGMLLSCLTWSMLVRRFLEA